MSIEEMNWRAILSRNDFNLDICPTEAEGHFEFFPSRQGALTCKYSHSESGQQFMLHSQYDPLKEATKMIEAQIQAYPESQRYIVYGFGCGHHIRELLSRCDQAVEVEVWETNSTFFSEVLKYADFTDILYDKRVKLIVGTEVKKFADSLFVQDGLALIIHQPSLRIMPKPLSEFRKALELYHVKLSSIKSFSGILEQNYQSNLQLAVPSIEAFINQFAGAPVVMVSAGPSLLKNVHELKRAKKHCLICCVGTALKILLENEIEPDFFMIIDPKELVLEQLEGLFHLKIPFFFLSTVHPSLPRFYQGPKYIVFQAGYPLAEKQAMERGIPAINSGGSVATALFDLLLKFGFSPICLIGQDLAYTNLETHAKGTHNYRKFSVLNHDIIEIPSFDQNGFVPTSKQLLVYLKWFVNVAKKENRLLYNATEGGAYIDGFQHIRLNDFINSVEHINIEAIRSKFQSIVKGHYYG
jgi:hypothetical protein